MRTKSWIDRIPLILERLECGEKAVYTRLDIEELFKIQRSRAGDLLKAAGAEPINGIEATISRELLLWYVSTCPESAMYVREIERKKAMRAKLAIATEEQNQLAQRIPIQHAEEWTRWADVPGVSLRPGELSIRFETEEELLHTLWLISRAMANEPGRVRELTEMRTMSA